MNGESSRYDSKLESMLQDGSSEPDKLKLPLEYLRNITNNFSDDRRLGQGGFGTVYKGVLQNGETIAVKKFNSSLPGPKDQFENEASHLMRLKHPNVVLLVGWCSKTHYIPMEYNGTYVCAEKSERLLCLEYMPKGNLREYLSDELSGLGWDTRYKIIEGICYGLRYLHEEWQLNASIVHMDLKPANILLDNNMVPKIADFGLSRFISEEKTWTTISRDGTLGYMSPEYINRGIVSTKSDIFSLGVIIIEMVTGRRYYADESGTSSKEFIKTVLYNWTRRNLMESSNGNAQLKVDYHQKRRCSQITRCIQIGLDCVEIDWRKRPTISQIMRRLNGVAITACDACFFLWELRKYVLLQATLAATVTYPAAWRPCGTWPDNDCSSTGARLAGDPVTYARRYKAFLYFNDTAFVASIITITLFLEHTISGHTFSRHGRRLRALEVAIVLYQLGLIGAYAAGSCREHAMSAFVVSLVALVSSYVCAHVLLFVLCALRRSDANASTDDVLLEDPGTVERSRMCFLLFATLVATVTYRAGLSMPGGFLSHSQDNVHLAWDPMLRDHHRDRFMGFFYFNTTAFVASLVVIMMQLMSPTVTRQGFRLCALWTGVALIGLTGAFACGKLQKRDVALVVAWLLPSGSGLLRAPDEL